MTFIYPATTRRPIRSGLTHTPPWWTQPGPEDLIRKYSSELHANEIVLLAYYIAAINIEAAYHGVRGGQYEPFANGHVPNH